MRTLTARICRQFHLQGPLLLLLLLVACGQKGPVRPLIEQVPGPVTGASLSQQGKSLVLRWRLPIRNLDGTPLRQTPQLDLFRMSYDPANDCPDCADRSILLATIEPDLPAPALLTSSGYLLRDRNLTPGSGYQYRLVPRLHKDAGAPTVLRQTYLQPPPAPRNASALPEDRGARLSWEAPLLGTEETLIGYQIYRRSQNLPLDPAPINSLPLQKTHFDDFSLENGRTYIYLIRALVRRGDQQLEGVASPDLPVTPLAPF